MPVFLQFCNLCLNNACLFILCDDLGSNSLGLLTENISKLLCFAGLENDIALESTAGVCVVVELTAESLLYTLRISIASVRTMPGG